MQARDKLSNSRRARRDLERGRHGTTVSTSVLKCPRDTPYTHEHGEHKGTDTNVGVANDCALVGKLKNNVSCVCEEALETSSGSLTDRREQSTAPLTRAKQHLPLFTCPYIHTYQSVGVSRGNGYPYQCGRNAYC